MRDRIDPRRGWREVVSGDDSMRPGTPHGPVLVSSRALLLGLGQTRSVDCRAADAGESVAPTG